jgi:hypothetical protein
MLLEIIMVLSYEHDITFCIYVLSCIGHDYLG